MKKKTVALFLLVGICFASYSVIPSSAHVDCDKGTDDLLEKSNFSADADLIDDVEKKTIRVDDELEEKYVRTYFSDSSVVEHYRDLCDTPEYILDGTTKDLLDYFLNSDFLFEKRHCGILGNSLYQTLIDNFSHNKAFAEFLKRDDSLSVLESYVANGTIGNEEWLASLILNNCDMRQKVDCMEEKDLNKYSAIRRLISVGDSVEIQTVSRPVNRFTYYVSGSIQSANGEEILVSKCDEEWNSSQKTQLDEYYIDRYNVTSVYKPSAKYNGHTYAWYNKSSTNPYWINYIDGYKNDSGCSVISSNEQVGDIVVYRVYNKSKNAYDYVHSARITRIASNGKHTVESKWGDAGVYSHLINNVPIEYQVDPSVGKIEAKIYRYHHYLKSLTGEQHSGNQHYFYLKKICKLCGASGGNITETVKCNGNPCIIPYSRPGKEEVA